MIRKYIYKNIYLLCNVVLCMFSCSENEKEISLGNNFFYIPYQDIIFDVTTFDGNGIYINKNGRKIPVVLPNIEKYKYNLEYIIVKQNFDIKQTTKLIENMLFMPGVYFTYDKKFMHLNHNYLSTLDKTEQKSMYSEKFTKELLKSSVSIQKMKKNQENLYIISKKEQKIYGPLNSSEFQILKNNLRINLSFD